MTATILIQLLALKTAVELGRLDTRRDLTYVDDAVEASLRAGVADGIKGETIQLGTGRSVSIAELFEAACSALGVRAMQYVGENPYLVVGLLYLDVDIYLPTRVALENFVPRMPEGAIIAFHELGMKSWPGETIAALETLKLQNFRLERFPFGSTISFAEIG